MANATDQEKKRSIKVDPNKIYVVVRSRNVNQTIRGNRAEGVDSVEGPVLDGGNPEDHALIQGYLFKIEAAKEGSVGQFGRRRTSVLAVKEYSKREWDDQVSASLNPAEAAAKIAKLERELAREKAKKGRDADDTKKAEDLKKKDK